MAEFFREIEDDVRRDRLLGLWLRWRWALIGAASALVLGTAGAVGWRAWQGAAATDRGERFIAAMRLAEEESHTEAARAFAQFSEAEGGAYGALARLRQAAVLAGDGDRSGAIAAYNDLIDSGANPLYADLAQVLAAPHLLDRGETRAIEQRLGPVADGAGPWRFMAREMLAAAALQDGRLTEARQIFEAVRDEAGVPDGVRARATQLIAALGGEE